MNSVVLKPRVSEKSYRLSQSDNTYVFDVPLKANKITVAQAVMSQFKVNVLSVNLLINKGKTVKSYRKGKKPVTGRRINTKRAYVKIKSGESIPVFANVEDKKEGK